MLVTGGETQARDLVATGTLTGRMSCQGTMELLEVTNDAAALLGAGLANCPATDDVIIVLNGEVLQYRARNRDEPEYWISATLRHEG